MPNTQSAKALSLLEKDFPSASGSSDQIVLYAPAGTLRGGPLESRATEMLDEVAHLPYVRSVASPFSGGGAGQVSKDGQVAFATVTFTAQSQDVPKTAVERVIGTAQAAHDAHLQVALGGQDIEAAEAQGSSSSTGAGIVLALIVLGIAFGALFAAFLPLITALIAIAIGYSLTGRSATCSP